MSPDPAEPTACPRPPGRPRSERAERAIIEATVDLLAAGTGISSLSIEQVAAQAGVGKATIYRRWPNKEALLIDALAAIKDPTLELPGTSVRDDLIAIVEDLRRRTRDPRLHRIYPCLLAEATRHAELYQRYRRQIVERRREVVRKVIRRGQRVGELRDDLDVDLVVHLICAPMLFLTLVDQPGEEPPEDLPARVVDTILDGVAVARPAS